MIPVAEQSRIIVVGEGSLAEAVAERFGGAPYPSWAALPEPGGATLVAVCPAWRPAWLADVNRRALRDAVPLLLVHPEIGSIVIGPLVVPAEAGCVTCADTRQHRALLAYPHERAVHERVCSGSTAPATAVTSAAVRQIVATLVAREVDRHQGGRQPLTRRAFYRIDARTAAIERHRFLADPGCPDCGQVPADSARAAEVRLSSQRKLAPTTYRVRALDSELDRLMAIYTDREAGLVSAVAKDGGGIFAGAVASLGLWQSVEPGVGRALDYRSAATAAIAEALERYGGLRPVGKATVVRNSYARLGPEVAVNPRSLGLPAPERIDHPGSRYRPYHPDQVMNWVWAYSFGRRRPVLVPESCAYYYLPQAGDPPFLYEISNGCALGGCLEEAILHGLMEVAERDAFLITWYARLPVPRVDPASAEDPRLPLMVERFEHLTGYRIHGYNITMPEGVPSFWVMAVDEQDRPGHPKALCAAGASLDPEQAFRSALQEVAGFVPRAIAEHPTQRARGLGMLDNPDRVAHMDDHWVLYAQPEAWPRLGFLDGSGRTQKFREAFAPFYDTPPDNLDLTVDLMDLVDRYRAGGLDVLVVDQTAAEHRVADLRCVKVLVPGTLSMTFGHRNRRTGVPRLRQVPRQLGYRSGPLPDADINPHPHPFP